MNSSVTLNALSHPLVVMLIGLAVLALWRDNTRRKHYLLWFGISYLAYGVGVTAQIILVPTDYVLNVLFSGLMYLLAALMFARGLIALAGAAYRYGVPVAIVIFAQACRLYFLLIDDNGAMRATCLHGSIFLLFLHAAYMARTLRHGLVSEKVTFYAFLLFTLTTPLKLLLTASRPANSYGFDLSSYWAVTTISIYAFALVFGLALIIAIIQRNQQAKQAADESLSLISHDLRAPLATIVGNLHLLQQSATPEQMAHIQAIERSTAYQLSLIDDILAGQDEASPLRIDPAQMSIKPFLAELCLHGDTWCTQNNSVFSLDVLTPLPGRIHSDERRLKQVLLNLLSNAALATHDGRVALRVECAPDGPGYVRIRFDVQDTGPGIEIAHQPLLFNARERFDLQRPGCGLGLYIAQRIADSLGGTLAVNSEPGNGSCFSLTLRAPSFGPDAVPRGWEPGALASSSYAAMSGQWLNSVDRAALNVESSEQRTPPHALCQQLASYASEGRYSDIQDWINLPQLQEPHYQRFRLAIQTALDDMRFSEILALTQKPTATPQRRCGGNPSEPSPYVRETQ